MRGLLSTYELLIRQRDGGVIPDEDYTEATLRAAKVADEIVAKLDEAYRKGREDAVEYVLSVVGDTYSTRYDRFDWNDIFEKARHAGEVTKEI